MVVLSALLVTLPGTLLNLPNAGVVIGVGVLLIAADVVLRLMNRGEVKWLTGDRTGGYLFFIPVWIFGVVMIILNLINVFIIKK